MNEMYNMGLSIHSLGSIAFLSVIVLNILMLRLFSNVKKYKRVMSIFLLPLTATVFGIVVFTGVIMMAAKHLEFSIENIVMILISLIFILLETKRVKFLNIANKILYLELFLIISISIWMWIR